MGAPYGTGSRASHEAASCTASSPKASIPSAIELMSRRIDAERLRDWGLRTEQAGARLAYQSDINGWNTNSENLTDATKVLQAFEAAAIFYAAASAIEARSDETRSGSAEGESAAPSGETPNA